MKRTDSRIKRLIANREASFEWHRTSHEVVKYQPRYYNKEGFYEKDEWTSMWDIGNTIGDQLVTKEMYLTVENQYADVALDIMKTSGCRLMTIVFDGGIIEPVLPELIKESPLGREDADLYLSLFGLESGSRVPLEKSTDILRLALREWKNCTLINLSHDVLIDVGYDFYMHVHSCLSKDCLRRIVESHHLYFNPRSPRSPTAISVLCNG